MSNHEKINYLEIPVTRMLESKAFFEKVFDWRFTDYGPDYCAVDNVGIDLGFFQSDRQVAQANGSVLVVFYSDNLEETLAKLKGEGAEILQPIFSFPGGRRFHFSDPSGNEYAVWSDQGVEQ